MTLSILIPTHNYTCYRLILELQHQAERLGIDYEIILAEDGSRSQVSIIANHKVVELPHCRHLIRRDNVGRAEIRNILARESQGEWLLYIDSDADAAANANFLAQYMEATSVAPVVCGGYTAPEHCPSPDHRLRYSYELYSVEKNRLECRMAHPYAHFSTFSFIIRRDVFLSVGFDASMCEYGHEDTIFGLTLKERGIAIHHIDNPLIHQGIDTNREFVEKTEMAVANVRRHAHKMRDTSQLLQTMKRIERLHLMWALRIAARLLRTPIRRRLVERGDSLRLLGIYKVLWMAGTGKANPKK